MNTKKLCGIAILTALYCVLASMLKIPVIGAISLDLGYIALAVGCSKYYGWGAVIGAIGCGIESILFSPYGFSISWFIANAIIGLGCGYLYHKTSNNVMKVIGTIAFVCLGVLVVKTVIECNLYGIPLAVKIPKNLVAFLMDSATMIVGLLVYDRIKDGV